MRYVIAFCLLALTSALPAAAGESAGATLRLSVAHADDSLYAEQARAFAEGVRSATGGRIAVQVTTNASGGGDADLYDQVQRGSIDLCLPVTAVMARTLPDLALLNYPFEFRNPEQAAAAYETALPIVAQKAAVQGVHILGWIEAGTAVIFAREPLTDADANPFRGLSLGVDPDWSELATAFRTLGASVASVRADEQFAAVAGGQLAAGENMLAALVKDGAPRQGVGFVVNSRHFFRFQAVCVSNRAFYAVPEDLRDLLAAGIAAGIDAAGSLARNAELDAVSTLRDAGVEVLDLDTAPLAGMLEQGRVPLEQGASPELREAVEEGKIPTFFM